MFRNFIKKILKYFLNAPTIKNGVTINGDVKGLQNVKFEGKNGIGERCNFSGNISVGYATTLGQNNFLNGVINIGKYCQLGADVAIHSTNHPISYLSTYINKNLFDGEMKKNKEIKEVSIGNDVWIGHGVIIVGNVTVGNGAILAAGSVVTKDVEPYSIVVGVPAKKIKKRFDDSVIKEIEQLKWWDKSEKELEDIKPLFFKNLEKKNSIY